MITIAQEEIVIMGPLGVILDVLIVETGNATMNVEKTLQIVQLIVEAATTNAPQEKQIINAQATGFKKENVSIILQQDVMNGLIGLIMKIVPQNQQIADMEFVRMTKNLIGIVQTEVVSIHVVMILHVNQEVCRERLPPVGGIHILRK